MQALEVGMHFDSLDILFEYYKEYGKQEGFGIVKRASWSFGNLRFVTLSCSQAGIRNSEKKLPQSESNDKNWVQS